MTPNLDELLRTASALIREYGEYARTIAAMRADAGLDNGSMVDVHCWHKILKAIEAVQDLEPKPGETIN